MLVDQSFSRSGWVQNLVFEVVTTYIGGKILRQPPAISDLFFYVQFDA